jgi:adenine deaminase
MPGGASCLRIVYVWAGSGAVPGVPEAVLQLAFLRPPVLPHLQLTDLGLVDVDRFELIAA